MVDTSRALPPERRGSPANQALIEARVRVAGLAAIQQACGEVERRETVLGGVDCLDVGAPTDPVLLYMHGGGFRMGTLETWFGLASRIAQAGALRVIVPDYRLAPEHPFPAGLADVCAVYRALTTAGWVPHIGGDSAGGGLACSLALWARGEGLAEPRGIVLLSPWLDLSLSSETFDTNADTDSMFDRASAQSAADDYLQGLSPEAVLASPGREPSRPFPPILVFASSSETLLGDALSLARSQAKLGGAVELVVCPGQPHVWPIMKPGAFETQQVIDRVALFARAPST